MTETGVPRRLQRIVLHALWLHPGNTILCPTAFESLFRYIDATGRYGSTAFLGHMVYLGSGPVVWYSKLQ